MRTRRRTKENDGIHISRIGNPVIKVEGASIKNSGNSYNMHIGSYSPSFSYSPSSYGPSYRKDESRDIPINPEYKETEMPYEKTDSAKGVVDKNAVEKSAIEKTGKLPLEKSVDETEKENTEIEAIVQKQEEGAGIPYIDDKKDDAEKYAPKNEETSKTESYDTGWSRYLIFEDDTVPKNEPAEQDETAEKNDFDDPANYPGYDEAGREIESIMKRSRLAQGLKSSPSVEEMIRMIDQYQKGIKEEPKNEELDKYLEETLMKRRGCMQGPGSGYYSVESMLYDITKFQEMKSYEETEFLPVFSIPMVIEDDEKNDDFINNIEYLFEDKEPDAPGQAPAYEPGLAETGADRFIEDLESLDRISKRVNQEKPGHQSYAIKDYEKPFNNVDAFFNGEIDMGKIEEEINNAANKKVDEARSYLQEMYDYEKS